MDNKDELDNEIDYHRLKKLVSELTPEGIDRLKVFLTRDVVSTNEFSNAIGISSATVRRWLRLKQLKGKRIGRKWFIQRSELERILNPD